MHEKEGPYSRMTVLTNRGLLASRAVREHICVVSSGPVCGKLLQQELAQRGQVSCPRLHSWEAAPLRFQGRFRSQSPSAEPFLFIKCVSCVKQWLEHSRSQKSTVIVTVVITDTLS